MKTVDYIIADPAGNITILVLSPADRSEYQEIASALLDKHRDAEQVAFVLPPQDPPAMEMCGLEFCGNASRSFAYYEALKYDPPLSEITVKVSGAQDPLRACIDAEKQEAKIEMPLPSGAEKLIVQTGDGKRLSGILVRMDGIAHLVLSENQQEDPETLRDLMDAPEDAVRDLFCRIRDDLAEAERRHTGTDFPAFGIMFLDYSAGRLRPVVYVRDVNTIYFEGSCASGSAASAYAMALLTADTEFLFRQPAGELSVRAEKDGEKICGMLLSGSVALSEVLTAALP